MSLIKSALILGASGLVGRQLLQQLLDDPRYASVTCLVRRPLAKQQYRDPHNKLQPVVIDFEDPGTEDVEKERSWDDTLATRLGATYNVTPQTEVRLGGFFDPSPVPEQTVGVDSPDSTRVGFTTGFGTMLSATTGLDVAYQYIHFQGAQSTATESPLSFEGAAHLLGVSLRYVL